MAAEAEEAEVVEGASDSTMGCLLTSTEVVAEEALRVVAPVPEVSGASQEAEALEFLLSTHPEFKSTTPRSSLAVAETVGVAEPVEVEARAPQEDRRVQW